MKEDHIQGFCHCYEKETQVRWKNIYHMGSEGLWICMPCELKLVKFIQKLRSKTCKEKLLKYKNIKIKNNIKK